KKAHKKKPRTWADAAKRWRSGVIRLRVWSFALVSKPRCSFYFLILLLTSSRHLGTGWEGSLGWQVTRCNVIALRRSPAREYADRSADAYGGAAWKRARTGPGCRPVAT